MTVGGSSGATEFSVALLHEFVALGVRDVVLSPGSRSQALALAAAEFERAGRVRLRVRIDERVAGFLALGLAVETRMPVLVVTTSGTAVANLHPAVLEAYHSAIPLILLTADRPAELRGIGANQTTQQVGLFGPAVSFVHEVETPAAASDGRGSTDYARTLAREAFSAAAGHSSARGPVQVNLAFREPLSAAVDTLPPAEDRPIPNASVGDPHPLPRRDGTVVIAGHDAGPEAERLARELGAPLLAEVSSGARFGPNLVASYRALLATDEFGGEVRRAIVFGHPTLSREVPALLQRDDVDVVVVRGRGAEAYNPGRRATAIVEAVHVAGEPEPRAWVGRWVQASRDVLEADAAPRLPPRTSDPRADQARFSREQLAAFRAPVTRRSLVDAVWRATWPHDRLVLGASRLIRELDKVAPGKRIAVHANRGLAGIDGTVSTAAGIALAAEADGATGTTRVLLGDLALLHDAGGLLFGSGEPRPRLQVIVGNDGGGTIFDALEVAASAPAEAMDRVLYTPHSARLGDLAAAYGWQYRRVDNAGELDESLTASESPVLVEVPLPR